MAKFMILYCSNASASDVMANASPEEMQASMGEWIQWKENASQSFKVDFGMPLQAVGRISADGVSESDSKASGYSIIEGGSKEGLMGVLASHPHLKRQGNWIDVLEMLPMPGLDA